MTDDQTTEAVDTESTTTDVERSPEELAGPQQDPAAESEPNSPAAEGDTFPRAYVEELRQENGKYRQDARDAGQRADELAQRLHAALVAADGRLQDPSDLPFDDAHLDDPDALAAAVDDLLTRKPHLAARRVTGDVGQGAGNSSGTVDLLGLLGGQR
ncbi:hypothetical protein [Tsukamurella spumae]|uniref:Uncharacterized protein n=1 Tax=Tsukamurella spumae TaxID=44753 RepID=A0A846X9S0_9ACTN|nr:hypothetical protein [Tsukamurella spumae]NKY21009.1 hypothetical protein [Tsukamurella spumae]